MIWRRAKNRGFALVELMVVVLIISVLATLAIPAVKRLQTRAKATTIANDFRVFSAAFDTYAQESGSWPADTAPGVMPAGMEQRLGSTSWTRQTPMGGRYNWERNQLHFGSRFAAALTITAVAGSPVPADANLLVTIDRHLDDGNLVAGNVRIGAGMGPLFVIQP